MVAGKEAANECLMSVSSYMNITVKNNMKQSKDAFFYYFENNV